MTLHEHVKKLYDAEVVAEIENAGERRVRGKLLAEWHEKAYDELRAELDEKKEAVEELETWVNRCRDDLHRMADALGLEKDKVAYAEIADRAVEAIKELTRLRKIEAEKQPEPPKKAVYEWQERVMQEVLYRDGNKIGACTTALKPISWNVFYADGMIRGVAHTIPLAKAAVEAIVRAHYGDAA